MSQIDLDRVTTALASNATALQSLIDLAKAKHQAEQDARAAQAAAETALQPAADAVSQIVAFIEASSAKITQEIANFTSNGAPANIQAPAEPQGS